jgi:GNAT superfamily N-acetyltransferase
MSFKVKQVEGSYVDNKHELFLNQIVFDIIECDIENDVEEKIGEVEIYLSNDFSNYSLNDIFWDFDEYVSGGLYILSSLFKRGAYVIDKLQEGKGYDEGDLVMSKFCSHLADCCGDLPRLFILNSIKIRKDRENKGIGEKVILYLEETYGYSRLKILLAAPLNNDGGNYEGIDFAEKQKRLNNFYKKIGYKQARKKPFNIFYKSFDKYWR